VRAVETTLIALTESPSTPRDPRGMTESPSRPRDPRGVTESPSMPGDVFVS
jgi:hypothetical protein